VADQRGSASVRGVTRETSRALSWPVGEPGVRLVPAVLVPRDAAVGLVAQGCRALASTNDCPLRVLDVPGDSGRTSCVVTSSSGVDVSMASTRSIASWLGRPSASMPADLRLRNSSMAVCCALDLEDCCSVSGPVSFRPSDQSMVLLLSVADKSHNTPIRVHQYLLSVPPPPSKTYVDIHTLR